jgi:3-hydroxyisobutyrate dehydrogenase-like beta-hydroxyacid dehydrogenase
MVGTGNMGGRMTRRMVEAGHHVLAVDADPARIPGCGATPAKDLAELAARCSTRSAPTCTTWAAAARAT